MVDFYFNSWRLVPANLVWGVVLVALVLLVWVWTPALVLLPLLALPTAGLFRMAALIQRGEAVALSDALRAWRRFGRPALLLGAVLTLFIAVFVVNMSVGFGSGDPLGWFVATTATWSLIVVWVLATVAWPLLVDPRREPEPLARRLRLAAMLVLAFPIRMTAVTVVVTLLLLASAVAFAALVTISVAYSALVVSRYVLPAADRLEGRATHPLPQ